MLRKLLALFVALALLIPAPVSAQHILNVRDADIRAFIQDAARVTGRTFVVDERVQGTVSVVTSRPLSRSEYFEIFLSTLRANGLVAVPTSGGAYRIQPVANAASQPSRLGTRGASANQLVTEVFRLRSISAAAAVETLQPLVSPEGSITANRNANSLVVVDFADNVGRIRALLGRIDTDSSAMEIVNLENAGPRDIAQSLTTLATQGLVGDGAVAPVAVVPIDASNAIALRGDAGAVARFAAMARELDARAALGTEIRVHWLDYANAEDMLPVIQTLLGQNAVVVSQPIDTGGAPALEGSVEGGPPPAAPAAGGATVMNGLGGRGPAVVTRFEGANAVIVAASPDTQRMIGELIRQLDRRQDQVLVEAIIVEISDSLARELGVQFLVGGEDAPFAVTNFSNVTPNILDVAGGLLADEIDQTTTVINGDVVTTTTNSATGDFLRQNAAQSILAARGGFGGFLATLGGNVVLGALINAVRADNESHVLSTPSLTVNNNLTGHILFGQEIPVSTGEALSSNFDNAFRTIQRQNVGIELEVTPQINADNEVRLVINQEVSSIVGPVSDDFNELIINKREINTTVTVGDGEIIALGGLLDDNERRTIQRIPILGDIPIIGELFRSRARSRVKTNLMVFIRPQILRSRADARAVAARRYGYVRGQILARNPDVEPSIDQLVRDYLGTTPPAVAIQPGDAVYGTPVPPSGPVTPVPVPPPADETGQ